MKDITSENLKHGLHELERRWEELVQRFPEEAARFYAEREMEEGRDERDD